MAPYTHTKVGLQSPEDLIFLCRYYLDTLSDPFVMDDSQCAAMTESAFIYYKLPYSEKVRMEAPSDTLRSPSGRLGPSPVAGHNYLRPSAMLKSS